jgi:hypothetical protein
MWRSFHLSSKSGTLSHLILPPQMKKIIFALLAVFLLTIPSALAQEGELASYQEVYEAGIEFGFFLEQAERRKEMWHDNFEKGSVPEELLDRARAVEGAHYLLAVAVDGCSDSVNTIPYLAHLANRVDGLEMRLVHPDAGRFIMEANRTPDGRASTPTVLVLDADFNEVGVFIERPQELQDWALGEGKDLESRDFMTYKFSWYDEDLGHQTMETVVEILEATK